MQVQPIPPTPHEPARESPPAASTATVVVGTSKRENWGPVVSLLTLFVLICIVIASPFIASSIYYETTKAKLRAEYDVALETLPELGGNLGDLVNASRMVVRKVSPSVVSIHRADIRGGDGQGSGVIVDPEGYVLTNYHVVEGATGIDVHLADGRIVPAGVVGGDQRCDLAVLKVDAPNLIAAEWGESRELEQGDLVWALGSPFGLERSVTFGIVSAKQRRSSSGATESPFREYLQTDVAVNPGNSGGPLVGLDGRLVGINTAIVGQVYQGISFAIPSEVARNVYEKLREKGWIERGYLGVMPQSVPTALRSRLQLDPNQGVLAATVSQLTPAERAGMRQGDVILQWNGEPTSDPFLLTQSIAESPIGSKANVVVKRLERGEPVEVNLQVTVGSAPRLEQLAP